MRTLVYVTLPLLLYGCGGPVETRLLNSGSANLDGISYAWPEKPTGQSAEYAKARSLLENGFAGKGWKQDKNAKALLQFTLSQRPAKLALKKGKQVIALPKKKKPFQSCEDKEYRLTVRLTQISDGSELYSGEAAEYHCNASFADALPAMVDAIMADMGAGRGKKAIKRSGLE